MALTQLSDAIIPEIYLSYTAEDSPELTAFYESGVAVRNGAIDGAFQSGGVTCNLPFWKDLDANVEPNYSTDDPTDVAVPNKVSASKMVARIAEMNQGYSAADLVAELAGSNPMQRIRNRFGRYWTRQWQRRVLAVAKGVYAKNVLTNNSDMCNIVAVEDANEVTEDNLFTRKNFTAAVFTLGDAFGKITAIAVHSVVMKRMVDNDDIEFIADSQGKLTIPTYMGRRVIVDDGMPVAANNSANGYKYTSMLFGEGAIGYGERSPQNAVEVFRNPQGGNGGGIEELWERKSWVLHPLGHVFTSASVAGESPTYAELALAANWIRVYDRKNVPLAFLVTNG